MSGRAQRGRTKGAHRHSSSQKGYSRGDAEKYFALRRRGVSRAGSCSGSSRENGNARIRPSPPRSPQLRVSQFTGGRASAFRDGECGAARARPKTNHRRHAAVVRGGGSEHFGNSAPVTGFAGFADRIRRDYSRRLAVGWSASRITPSCSARSRT